MPGYEEGGGVPAVADFLSNALRRRGDFSVALVSMAVRWNDPLNVCVTSPRTWCRGPRTENWNEGDVPQTRVGAWWAEAEFMRYLPRAVLDHAVGDADVVQVICGSAASAYALRRVRKPLFIQVATTLRTERAAGKARGTAGWHLNFMTRVCELQERAAVRSAAGVFVENRWLQTKLEGELSSGRVHFAPPGVDVDFYRPDPAVERDILLFVGRLSDPRKNVRLLLEAYRMVREFVPSAPRLVLAGYTGLTSEDERFVQERGLGKSIVVCTKPDRACLALLYRRCRAFVLSSNEEGFGIVLTEAMASGAPVVSTACGGPSGIVEDGATGFLVPVGDATALAQRIAVLLADEKMSEEMGQAGRRKVEREFSSDACGARFAAVYQSVVGNGMAAGVGGR